MGDLTVSEVLSKAADLIEPEGAWTQGAFARTAKERAVGPEESPAVCWCLAGALMRAAPNAGATIRNDTLGRCRSAVAEVIGMGNLASWNDDRKRTQAQVVAALRKASKLATPPNEPSAAMGKGGGG